MTNENTGRDLLLHLKPVTVSTLHVCKGNSCALALWFYSASSHHAKHVPVLCFLSVQECIIRRLYPSACFITETNNGVRIQLGDEPGSSVSIVSDYGLDGRVSIPDRGRGFFL
jgi:hypothetical protein